MKTTSFAIGGMHCAACAARNERALAKLAGVLKANVNYATTAPGSNSTIAAVSEHALHEAVLGGGYTVLTGEFAAAQKERRAGGSRRAGARLSGACACRTGHGACDVRNRIAVDDCRQKSEPSGFRPFSARSWCWALASRFTAAWCGRPESVRQHGHAHLARHARGTYLQLVGDDRRRASSLFRDRRGHCRPYPAGPLFRGAKPRAGKRRH